MAKQQRHKVKCSRCGHTTETAATTQKITCGGCGYKTANVAVTNIKDLWIKACQYDNIPADSKFVNFSSTNPYATLYNQAMCKASKLITATIEGTAQVSMP
jgi:ribosomal protein S27AE